VDAVGNCHFDYIAKGTPLLIAAYEGNYPVASLLLDYGASVAPKGDEVDDRTPLHWAARNGDEEMVKLLLEHGADVDARDRSGYSPLHAAASGAVCYDRERAARALKTVELLLSFGAEVNAQTRHGLTPLDCAPSSSDDSDESTDEWITVREFLRTHGGYSGIVREGMGSGMDHLPTKGTR